LGVLMEQMIMRKGHSSHFAKNDLSRF